MSGDREPQGGDSKDKGKVPLPTLEPQWQPTSFPYRPSVPSQNLIPSIPPVSVDRGGANVLPGIDTLLAATGSFGNVDRRPSAPTASTVQQTKELALNMSQDADEATTQGTDATNSTTCPSCGEDFNRIQELDSHVADEHPDFRWQCSICEWKRYTTRQALRRHIRDHLGESLRYVCPVEGCGRSRKGFVHRKYFDLHMNNLHPGIYLEPITSYQNDVVAELTGFEPATSSDQMEATPHLHKILESTVCPVCGDELSHMSKLDKHVSENHPDFRWPCPICKKTYRERTYLRNHLKGPDHSPDAPRHYCPFKGCEYFRKSFGDKRHGHDHLKKRHPGQPEAELVLGTTLPGLLPSPKRLKPNPSLSAASLQSVDATPGISNLEGVESQHPPPSEPTTQQGNELAESLEPEGGRTILSNMLKTTICPVCASNLPTLTHLEEHLANHHTNFRWHCPLCTKEEKLYKVRSYLKVHVAMDHSGEQQRFYCPVEACKKSQTGYRKRWYLDQHIMDKHPERASIDPELQAVAPRNEYVFKNYDPGAET